MVAGLVTLVVTALLFVPSTAPAGLDDDIAAAFDEFINGLFGTEIDGVVVEGDLVCVPGTRHWQATVIGFAFCSPDDPWADPTPIPVPPYNVYGCENEAAIDVVVAPGESSADVLISIDPLFVDLEIEREEGLCYPLEGWGPDPPHYSDAYLLMDATFAIALELEDTGECVLAAIVPGSVDIGLGEQTRELELQGDDCLATAVELFEPALWELLLPQVETAFEAIIEGMMGDISDLLCDLTPVSSSTWGCVKALYRAAPESE
jgi:hypothetical protein